MKIRNETRAVLRLLTIAALAIISIALGAIALVGLVLITLGDIATAAGSAFFAWSTSADRWWMRCDWKGRRL